jgi:hypothetical protein
MNVSNYWSKRIEESKEYINELDVQKNKIEKIYAQNNKRLKNIRDTIRSKLAKLGYSSIMQCNSKEKNGDLGKLLSMQSELQYQNIAWSNNVFSICHKMLGVSLDIGNCKNNLMLASYIENNLV